MLSNKKSKLFCLFAVLSMIVTPFIGMRQSVYASSLSNESGEVVLDDIDKAVGESIYFSEETQTFFIDEVSAKWGGLNDIQISDLKTWINFLNEDPERIQQSLDYAGYSKTEITSRAALPPAVVKALIALGKGALAAVGGAIAKYGMQDACKRIAYKYHPFRDFCRANGWPVFGGGGTGW